MLCGDKETQKPKEIIIKHENRKNINHYDHCIKYVRDR